VRNLSYSCLIHFIVSCLLRCALVLLPLMFCFQRLVQLHYKSSRAIPFGYSVCSLNFNGRMRPLSALYWISLIRTLVHGSSQLFKISHVGMRKLNCLCRLSIANFGGSRCASCARCFFKVLVQALILFRSISSRSTFEEE